MDFMNKVRRLSCVDFSATEYSADEKELYSAARAFLLSDEEKAERIAVKLYESTSNEALKEAALSIIFTLMVWQDRFDDLHRFGIPRNENEAIVISLFNAKNTEIIYSDKDESIKLIPAEPGWAIITVQINGVDVELMVDTGAMVTTVNETTAKKCGVISGEATEGRNALGDQVSLAGSTIGSLTIGATEFRNQTCMVIPDVMIDFGEHKLNGTIGWDIIRRLKWSFDFKNGSVKTCKPTIENVEKNMMCDFFPMVGLNINGTKKVMCLDTGANKTKFGAAMKESFSNLEQLKCENITTGGAGSSRNELAYTLPGVDISIGNQDIFIGPISLMAETECSLSQFFITPGILGIDFAKDKFLVLDYFNRHLSVK